MKKNFEVKKNPNYMNQSDDIQITCLYRLAERNFTEETDRKKMRSFLEKIIKKNKQLESENSLLKEKIKEQNEVINAQKKKLINCDFIVKTFIKKLLRKVKNFLLEQEIKMELIEQKKFLYSMKIMLIIMIIILMKVKGQIIVFKI